MTNAEIHNTGHIISNLQSWFLLNFPYKREDMAIKSQLLIPCSFNSQTPQQQQ